MTVEEQLKDLKQIENELSNMDLFIKYKVYLTDICKNREKMIEKESNNIKGALNYIKPKFKKWIIGLFIISAILDLLFIYLKFELNNENIVSNGNIIDFFVANADFIFSTIETTSGQGFINLLNLILTVGINFTSMTVVGSFIYLVYKLLSIPFQYFYYLKEKKYTEKHLKKLQQKLSYDYAKQSLEKLERAISITNKKITELSEKHKIDEKLINRENIPFITELLKLNKEKALSIEQISNYIVSKGKEKTSVPLETWGEFLLHYDKNYTYYQNTNMWLEKYKQRHEKIIDAILFLPSLPLRFFKFQVTFVLSMFGASIGGSNKTEQAKFYFDPEKQYNFVGQAYNAIGNNYTFYDSNGNYCESGGTFYDGKGNYCEAGGTFYDGKGNYCESGSPFFDANGNYCDGTSPFYDGKGNLINPN